MEEENNNIQNNSDFLLALKTMKEEELDGEGKLRKKELIIDESLKEVKIHFFSFLISLLVIIISFSIMKSDQGFIFPTKSGSMSIMVLFITTPITIVLALTTLSKTVQYLRYTKK